MKVDRPTPSQEKSKHLIETLRSDIENLEGVLAKGFAAPEAKSQLKKLKAQLEMEKKALKKKKVMHSEKKLKELTIKRNSKKL